MRKYVKEHPHPCSEDEDEEQACPLCISPLDDAEREWLPCDCGYQLCLFCYDKLRLEECSTCPNCRKPYDGDVDAGRQRYQRWLARHQEEQPPVVVQAAGGQPSSPTSPEGANDGSAAAAAVRGGRGRKGGPPGSPARDLRLAEQQDWPCLGAGAPPAPRPRPRLALPRSSQEPACHEQDSSSSSASGGTAPQSPVAGVVSFWAAPRASSGPTPVQGRCCVRLQPSSFGGVAPDPEGTALAVSLQQAVQQGTLGAREAAAALVAYLRQREAAAAPGLAAASGLEPALKACWLGGEAAQGGSGTDSQVAGDRPGLEAAGDSWVAPPQLGRDTTWAGQDVVGGFPGFSSLPRFQ